MKAHQKYSGKKLQYFDSEIGESYVPYVIETSIGLDRMFLSVLSNSFKEEKIDEGERRVVLKIPAFLAPIKAAILPLTKKDGMPDKARELLKKLQLSFSCQYEEKDSIGKRYRRQDAIGTPYCITIDHQTKEDSTITIRERDSMSQERILFSEIEKYIKRKVSFNSTLSKML